jgi:hypothetical protein
VPDEPQPEPGHPVRRVSEEGCLAYRTLVESRADPDAAAVLTGDSGGTIFLTAPVPLIRCDEIALWTLVSDIDAVTWMCGGDRFCTRVDFEHRPIPSKVWGGDGGGQVIDGVWTHQMLSDELAEYSGLVVTAKIERIPSGFLQAEREAQLDRRRERRAQSAASSKRSADFYEKHGWDFDVVPPGVPFD